MSHKGERYGCPQLGIWPKGKDTVEASIVDTILVKRLINAVTFDHVRQQPNNMQNYQDIELCYISRLQDDITAKSWHVSSK